MRPIRYIKPLKELIFFVALVPLILLYPGCSFKEAEFVLGVIRSDKIIVTAGASGEVERIERGVGDRVKEGELILKIGLEDTEEKLKKYLERLQSLQEKVKEAKEEYEKSKIQIGYSKGRYLKNRMLFSKGAIAEREVFRTKEEYDFAVALNERAKRDYDQILGEIKSVEEEILKIEGEYGSVFVLSPETGFITKCFAWEGGYLLKGDRAAEIVKDGSVYFEGICKSKSGSGGIHPGDEAFVIPIVTRILATGTIRGEVTGVTNIGAGGNSAVKVEIRLKPESRWEILALGSREDRLRSVALIR
ncbi:MAG: hypothetical protein JW984_09830 [Deltaproteobacteria bacterium]|uniref:RND efflux pump membrane fusion protein barrel-sandwich domain-containing protein n=1 Tax=Candidatus Zymogenus saltonus TaxID=2844893 RepID=A0A9D8KG85_9DELT|nr:hypothetical protein [Candidatus Zymogenus saltonus]